MIDFITQNTFRDYILVEENADDQCKQTHNHLLQLTRYNNDQAYRRAFKKAMPNLSGNKDYSIKVGDEKGYYYVCKGTGPDWDTQKPNVISTSFSDDSIKEFHRMYWHIFAERHADDPKSDVTRVDMSGLMGEKPKKRTKMFVERIRDELLQQYPDHLWDMRQPTDRAVLVRFLRTKLGAVAKNLDDTIFMRMFTGLYNGLPRDTDCEGYEQDHYESLVCRRYC